MSKHNTPCHGGKQTKTSSAIIGDYVNYRSSDGAVEIITKVTTAKRYPKHNYPIVCIHLRPQPGSRVQKLNDGSGGVDVLLKHPEVGALIHSLVKADPKCSDYRASKVAEKPAERKQYWDQKNQKRWENRRN